MRHGGGAGRRPVTAVQHFRRENIEGGRDRFCAELGTYHEEVFGQRPAEPLEELQVQIRGREMRSVTAVVSPREKGPLPFAGFGSDQPWQSYARLLHPSFFLSGFIALPASTIGSEVM